MALASKEAEERKDPSYETGRFLLCPTSHVRHSGWFFVRVVRSKNRGAAWFWCTCRGRVYLPQDWQDAEGFTLEDVQRMTPYLGQVTVS